MAGKNWQAGSKSTLATAVVCLVASAFPAARTPAAPGGFQPSSYVGSLDPNMIWEVLIGSIVVASFVGAVTIWVVSALRRARRSQLRRNAFISTALNHLNQGVVMVDPRGRVIFCNDQYLNLYGLTRADVPPDIRERLKGHLSALEGVLVSTGHDWIRDEMEATETALRA